MHRWQFYLQIRSFLNKWVMCFKHFQALTDKMIFLRNHGVQCVVIYFCNFGVI